MPAIRHATRLVTYPPQQASPIAQVEASLLALLTASELHEPDAPAAKAYRASMRAKAHSIMATGGAEALDYLLERIRKDDPAKADVREAILETAWSGLPGWHA